MAKKLPGKLWFAFELFGLSWTARIAPAKSAVLDKGKTLACVLYNERLMYFSDKLTLEQQRTAFVHELQHAIEEHADVDYETAADHTIAERCTDQVARGWLYFIRHSPEVIAFLRAED